MMIAFFMIALEFPMPQLKQTMIHRSIVVRIVILVLQASMAILFYQVCKMIISEMTILIDHMHREQTGHCGRLLPQVVTRAPKY
jgi:predicted PurR-regulated permease PerM